MNRRLLLALVTVLAGAGALVLASKGHDAREPDTARAAAGGGPQVQLKLEGDGESAAGRRYVYEVSVHDPADIDGLLNRIEELAPRLAPGGDTPGFALVLHGPEVEFFASRNYTRYRALVDRARKLDERGIIEVKICQTQMRLRGISDREIPAFIERVPFGPDEVRRLGQRGYVVM